MTLIKVNELGPGDARREYGQFWVAMVMHVARAVDDSFREANMRNPTAAEVKDRTNKAKRIVDMLRTDFKWSRQRIADMLPTVLRAEILGLKLPLERMGQRAAW